MRKLQTPGLKLQGTIKPENLNYRKIISWALGFGASLKPGVWSLMLFLTTPIGVGQTAPAAAPVSSRYLLIVETSRTMQPRAAGVQKTIRDLLDSAMSGQLRRGDTLGIWTFGQALYTGKFPLQKWSPESKAEISINVAAFLREQTYEKKADLDQVLPALNKLIKSSDFITVILVSDGDEKISGTPFDNQINDFYKLWRDQQRKAQMPFLTILRASHGEITHHAMSTGAWTVEMPPLAPEIQALADAEKNAAAAPPKPQTSSVPPLIVYGKNSRLAQTSASPTNAIPAEGPAAVNAIPRIASTEGTNPITTAVTQFTPTNQPSAELSVNSAPVSGSQISTPPSPVKTTEEKPAESQPSTKTELDGRPSSISTTRTVNAPTNANQTSAAPPPVETVAAASSDAIATWKIVLAAGSVLLLAGAGIVFVRIRRSRAAAPLSLITRSLEREKKS